MDYFTWHHYQILIMKMYRSVVGDDFTDQDWELERDMRREKRLGDIYPEVVDYLKEKGRL
jgi:hypothetical protein